MSPNITHFQCEECFSSFNKFTSLCDVIFRVQATVVARAIRLDLLKWEPKKETLFPTRGLGSHLVSLVPCLGDAIGVVRFKKKKKRKLTFKRTLATVHHFCGLVWVYSKNPNKAPR